MKVVFGELVSIRESEYDGKPQYQAKVLERADDGDVNVFEVGLEPKHYGTLSKLVGQTVALTFLVRSGTSRAGARYTLFTSGRPLNPVEVDSVVDHFTAVPA